MSTFKRPAALLTALMLVSGCSSSATLTLRDGRQTSGRIVQSDQDSVVIERDGEYWDMKRDDIADVSHPGTGEMVGGAVLLGLAGYFAVSAATMPVERTRDCDTDCYASDSELAQTSLFLSAILLSIPGLILGIDGVATHYGSRSRYSATGGGHPIDFQTTRATALPNRPPRSDSCGNPQEKQSCEAGGGACLALGHTFVCVVPRTAAPTTATPAPELTPSIEPEPAPTDEPEPAPTKEPEPPEPAEPNPDPPAPAPQP